MKFNGGRLASMIIVTSLLLAVAAGGYFLGLSEQHKAEPEGSDLQTNGAVPVVPELPKTVLPLGFGPDTIADVAQKVSPSVVSIDVFSQDLASAQASPGSDFLFNGRRITSSQSPAALTLLPVMQRYGSGSGVIMRPDGYILTGNHVIKGGERIRVTLSSQRSFEAKVVGRDSLSDLAVLKIPANDLPVADFGSSRKLRPGQWAIAIGSPLGLPQTVTLGIISAIGRELTDVSSEISYIQTDAAINPGNSGGPLLNLQGEVVGINSFIRSDAQKIGFATPIETARSVSAELIAKGKINHAWAGMKMVSLTAALKAKASLPEELSGAMVVSVVESGPASLAGVKRGDVIVKVDAVKVASVKDISRQLQACRPQQSIALNVWRRGQDLKLPVKLTEMPEYLD